MAQHGTKTARKRRRIRDKRKRHMGATRKQWRKE
jgi:hypothetical protein